MFGIILLTWMIILFALKYCIWGNPAHSLVSQASDSTLKSVGTCLEERVFPGDEETATFLHDLFVSTISSVAIFAIETVLAWYLLFNYPKMWIAWIIVGKNLIMFSLSWSYSRRYDQNIIQILRTIPAWFLYLERAFYLCSAVCFFLIFLLLNKLA